MAVAISATLQGTYPPRVAVAVTGLTLGNAVVIYREVGGNRTAVRGGTTAAAVDTALATIDAELPFGIPVRYVAVVGGTTEYATSSVTYELTGGLVALSDAITGLAAEVRILAAGDQAVTKDSARLRVAGRNLVVGSLFGQPEGSYELYLETQVARDALDTLLRAATNGVVQLRVPDVLKYDGVDAYLFVDRLTLQRWSQDGSDKRRTRVLEFAEVGPWPATLTAIGFTYGVVEDFYDGLTYADAEGDFATYLDVYLHDFS